MTDTVPNQILAIRPSRIAGRVSLAGAKNSVLRLMAASLLTDDTIRINNYPAALMDAQVHRIMLDRLGKVTLLESDSIVISGTGGTSRCHLDWDGRSIRNTLLILGALVARHGEASVPLPGGCDLGGRGFDLHQLVLETLGARVWASEGRLHAEAPHGLTGGEIHLPLRSTGATENALIAGSLARGRTVLWNPHVRPEILDLARFLNALGARITVNGTESIEIEGVPALGGAIWSVMPDNMEAITWAIAAAVTGGEIEIAGFPFADLEVPLIFLRESGLVIERRGDDALVGVRRCFPVEIATGPYPGINSDMQPLFAALGAVARGVSHIVDLRFPDRYAYLDAFAQMGVRSEVRSGRAVIHGGSPLHGARVKACDLRAGAALALLGLVADGETVIEDAWQIDRGYCGFAEKLTALGASATSWTEEPSVPVPRQAQIS